MSASAESMGYGQLTSNKSKFRAAEWSYDCTFRCTTETVPDPRTGDRNTSAKGVVWSTRLTTFFPHTSLGGSPFSANESEDPSPVKYNYLTTTASLYTNNSF